MNFGVLRNMVPDIWCAQEQMFLTFGAPSANGRLAKEKTPWGKKEKNGKP